TPRCRHFHRFLHGGRIRNRRRHLLCLPFRHPVPFHPFPRDHQHRPWRRSRSELRKNSPRDRECPMCARPPRLPLATLYSWRAWTAKLSAIVIPWVTVRLIPVYSHAGRKIEIKAWIAEITISALCRNDRHLLLPHL